LIDSAGVELGDALLDSVPFCSFGDLALVLQSKFGGSLTPRGQQQCNSPTGTHHERPGSPHYIEPGSVSVGSATVEVKQCHDGPSSHQAHENAAEDDRTDRQRTTGLRRPLTRISAHSLPW
jgi:hypothetical protein